VIGDSRDPTPAQNNIAFIALRLVLASSDREQILKVEDLASY